MKRVLHVIGSMNRGGAESMIMSLYRKIDKEKIQFDFVTHTDKDAEYDKEIEYLGGRIFHCPHYNGKNHLKYVKWWRKFFSEHKEYNVIHGHIGSTASIYLYIAKKNGLHTIAHSHSTKMSMLYSFISYPTRFIAEYLFACSRLAGEYRYGKNVIDNKNFKVINNAVNVDLFKFNEEIRNKVRKELFLTDQLVVGAVGRLTDVKNPYGIVDIFNELQKLNNKSRLLWVGEGELHDKIVEYINSRGLNDKIVMTGLRNDVNNMMQAMDVFIMPSFYEGLPVVAIEAQANGLPCLLSDKITKETDISGTCLFLSLNNYHRWAEIISNIHLCRNDNEDKIILSGYDVNNTVRWLENFYLELQ